MTVWSSDIDDRRWAVPCAAAGAETLLRQVAEAVLMLADAADGAALVLADADGALRFVRAAGMLAPHAGTELDRQASLAGAALRSGRPVRCGEAQSDPRADRANAGGLPVRSLVYVPLGRGRSATGLIMLTSIRPHAFTDADVARAVAAAGVVRMLVAAAGELAKLTGNLINGAGSGAAVAGPGAAGPGAAGGGTVTGRTAAGGETVAGAGTVAEFVTALVDPSLAGLGRIRGRTEDAIARRAMDVVVQPIIELSSGEVVAFEALSRFTELPAITPDRWFADAERVGLGVELELCAAGKALHLLSLLPERVALAVNVGPATLCDPRLAAMVRATDAKRVVLEMTEHLPVLDYRPLIEALAGLRAEGVRLSVDDAGAGYASFAHIIELAPELIKLDRSLIAGIDTDPVRRALTTALVAFSHRSGSKVVAEGIETDEELATVTRLNVDLAQGFHLGRPAGITEHLGACLASRRAPLGAVRQGRRSADPPVLAAAALAAQPATPVR